MRYWGAHNIHTFVALSEASIASHFVSFVCVWEFAPLNCEMCMCARAIAMKWGCAQPRTGLAATTMWKGRHRVYAAAAVHFRRQADTQPAAAAAETKSIVLNIITINSINELGAPSFYFIIFYYFHSLCSVCVCLCVCLDTDSVQPSTTVDETDECAFAWHGRISFWLCTYFINVLIIKMYPRNIADSRQSRACICVYRCIFSSWNSATRVRCKLVRCKFVGEHTRPNWCSEEANNGFFFVLHTSNNKDRLRLCQFHSFSDSCFFFFFSIGSQLHSHHSMHYMCIILFLLIAIPTNTLATNHNHMKNNQKKNIVYLCSFTLNAVPIGFYASYRSAVNTKLPYITNKIQTQYVCAVWRNSPMWYRSRTELNSTGNNNVLVWATVRLRWQYVCVYVCFVCVCCVAVLALYGPWRRQAP